MPTLFSSTLRTSGEKINIYIYGYTISISRDSFRGLIKKQKYESGRETKIRYPLVDTSVRLVKL